MQKEDWRTSRASMRLMRPFQLADPPSPDRSSSTVQSNAVQIELPPVFPCDVIERPCSTPAYDRPRQYGRRFSSFVASSSESPLSLSRSSSNSNSVSTLTWENDTNGARIVRQPEPSLEPTPQHRNTASNTHDVPVNRSTSLQNESVSSNVGTQLSARTIPTTG